MASRTSIISIVAILIVLMTAFLSDLHIVHAGLSWSSPILVDASPGTNMLPTALQATNGTLWLAWQSNRNGLSTGRFDIVYKTYTNGVWSIDHNLTTSGNNSSPTLVQLNNGTILIFWVVKTGSIGQIFSESYNGQWSSPVQVTTTNLADTQPSAAVGKDGTLWLVWTRINATNPNVPAVEQLYYKTLQRGAWSHETQLTTDTNQNFGSGIMVGKDGVVRVAWSKGVAGNPYQIYYKTYNASWSSDTQLVSSSSTDDRPSIMQDRNGTLWLFWGRLIVVSALVQYYVLYGKYSYDMGRTWSAEIQLSNTSTSVDSRMPSAVQSTYGVMPLWVFYTSNLNQPSYQIYGLMSSSVSPVHDVTITGTSVSSTGLTNEQGLPAEYPGGLASVGQMATVVFTVTVKDIGDYSETVYVSLSVTNVTTISLGTAKGFVGPGNTLKLYFYWNTSGATPARYGLSTTIAPLPGETFGNMADNSLREKNKLHILPLGDVNQDGNIDANDASVAIYDYGATPGSPRWNPFVDLNNIGFLDANDVSYIIYHYGTFT